MKSCCEVVNKMDEFISLMFWPLMACVILVGIHVYLGMHILLRQVIFVDLALAQIAALGSILGVVLGYPADDFPIYNKVFAFALASLGALFFALVRRHGEKIGQEAIVGISFVTALALAILLSTKLPHGADELQELFSGSILWVTPTQILTAGGLYLALGIVHYTFRDKFFAVSIDAHKAQSLNIPVRFWDFLFYFSFAIVVTSSVSIAGVLLVFAFLVIPASASFLLAQSLQNRLLLGWLIGTTVSIGGVTLSYFSDAPTGPIIVVLLSLTLTVIGSFLALRNALR